MFFPPTLSDGARWAGLRVGLLGGSFNPPHEGHLHASLVALQGLDLDCVWWLVTPQNPLKQAAELDFAERFDLCRQITAPHPRLLVTDLEQKLGTNLTWQTVAALRCHYPLAHFVWVTGMDNALTMHRWNRWTTILDSVATAHVARPPAWSLIETCPLRMLATQRHVFLDSAAKMPLLPHYTYWLMQKRMVGISSTALRRDAEFA